MGQAYCIHETYTGSPSRLRPPLLVDIKPLHWIFHYSLVEGRQKASTWDRERWQLIFVNGGIQAKCNRNLLPFRAWMLFGQIFECQTFMPCHIQDKIANILRSFGPDNVANIGKSDLPGIIKPFKFMFPFHVQKKFQDDEKQVRVWNIVRISQSSPNFWNTCFV